MARIYEPTRRASDTRFPIFSSRSKGSDVSWCLRIRPAYIVSVLAIVLVGTVACAKGIDNDVVLAGDSSVWSLASPALFADGSIYYMKSNVNNSDGPGELRKVDSSGKDSAVDLSAAHVDSCDVTRMFTLRSLPDGRLGAVVECADPSSKTSSIAIDRMSGEAVRLASTFGGSDAAWLPGLQKGWVERIGQGCRSIAPITPEGLLPVPGYSPRDLLPWSLDSVFYAESCAAEGQAGYLGLSESGHLYFLASPDSQNMDPGRGGLGRKGVTWNLYSLDLSSGSLRKIAESFLIPTIS